MSDSSGAEAGGDPPQGAEPPLTRREASARRDPAPPDPRTIQPDAVPLSHVRAARSEFEHQVAHARAEFDQANERIKERTGRDLILATIIGVAIGAVLVLSLIFLKWVFILFALAASILGIFEFSRALQKAGRRVDLVPQLIAATLLVVAGYFFPQLWLLWVSVFAAVAFVIVWRLVAQMVVKDGRTYGAVLSDTLIAGFLQLYVALLTSLCVVLLSQHGGEWWVLAFIITVVAADTGAYAAGLTFGKHPMAPRISPKKTWEGFAGAMLAALIAGALLAQFMLGLPWWAGLIIGVVILGTATVGDLGESMIKRDLGIKDMSSWLPGHGGVLDRLDSILPSAAAALALYYLLSPLAAS
ncbi:phosphatidate cytidylyltransferase [Microbacterium rhizomatis]|uniref:Phosphatidate cytidylyltransferase n=1 Tax=Microbacterium rhizomatis TaxID=1631477 RepID=A0A5J5J3R1_9MICO|nr:phosphatidate cytidylyltransferase [Microbacterium rhizomatis]KAA9110701.1 phosphatidate cytidylyltransferase [Microbacterium rhizomatis]